MTDWEPSAIDPIDLLVELERSFSHVVGHKAALLLAPIVDRELREAAASLAPLLAQVPPEQQDHLIDAAEKVLLSLCKGRLEGELRRGLGAP